MSPLKTGTWTGCAQTLTEGMRFEAESKTCSEPVQGPKTPSYKELLQVEPRTIVPRHLPRHPNSQRFHDILAELSALHDRKQADYGRGDDPFANIRASGGWGVAPWIGALIRANDKINRLQSLITNGVLQNESAEDSLRDLAVYAVIALVLFEEARAHFGEFAP